MRYGNEGRGNQQHKNKDTNDSFIHNTSSLPIANVYHIFIFLCRNAVKTDGCATILEPIQKSMEDISFYIDESLSCISPSLVCIFYCLFIDTPSVSSHRCHQP
jgi:hypothetical protein